MTYIIRQKASGSGSIHDIASDQFDREIHFGPGCVFAVVLAAYYGGKGYTTHKTEQTAIRAAKKVSAYSYEIIDTTGARYRVADAWDARLVRL